MRNLAAILLLALILSACHGQNFARPRSGQFTLGRTTRTEILSQHGEPTQESFDTPGSADHGSKDSFAGAVVPGLIDVMTYLDYTTGDFPHFQAVTFMFWDSKLVGYSYVSDFSDSSSDFDQSKAGNLRVGKMTSAEVVQLLGAPTGELIYPLIQHEGDKVFLYAFSNIAGYWHRQQRTKSLEILFGPQDTVQDYRSNSDSNPIPRRAIP